MDDMKITKIVLILTLSTVFILTGCSPRSYGKSQDCSTKCPYAKQDTECSKCSQSTKCKTKSSCCKSNSKCDKSNCCGSDCCGSAAKGCSGSQKKAKRVAVVSAAARRVEVTAIRNQQEAKASLA